jgi:hypothetical protein
MDWAEAMPQARQPRRKVRNYGLAISLGVVVANDNALREIHETLQIAERSADDLALGIARTIAGLALMHRDFPGRPGAWGHSRGHAVGRQKP